MEGKKDKNPRIRVKMDSTVVSQNPCQQKKQDRRIVRNKITLIKVLTFVKNTTIKKLL